MRKNRESVLEVDAVACPAHRLDTAVAPRVSATGSPGRLLARSIAVALGLSVGACGLVEKVVDDKFLNPTLKNDPTQSSEYEPTAADQAFFDSLFIVDLHADPLLYSRGAAGTTLLGEPVGHTDADRLIQGNVAVQVFSTVSQYSSPKTRRIDGHRVSCHDKDDFDLIGALTWLQAPLGSVSQRRDRRQRILKQSERFSEYNESSDKIMPIMNADDFESFATQWKDGRVRRVGGILAIEGLHFYDEYGLSALSAAGFRMASLTHHFDNRLGGSSTGCHREGLEALGKYAVKDMHQSGWVLDLAHASNATLSQALKKWAKLNIDDSDSRPALVSHTGLEDQCKNLKFDDPRDRQDCMVADARNTKKEEAFQVARQGGVIGVIYWSRQHGLDSDDSADAVTGRIVHTIERLDDHLSSYPHCADPMSSPVRCLKWDGPRYIALGSDWDGAIDSPFDATGLGKLIARLKASKCPAGQKACLGRGYAGGLRFSESDIRAIAGWNSCRVLMQSLPNGRDPERAFDFCEELKR